MNCDLLRPGRVFTEAPAAEVTAFLEGRSLSFHTLAPERLHLADGGDCLLLEMTNGSVHQYPVRRTFLLKLLKWYGFPLRLLDRLGVETVLGAANDFLLGIRSGDVTVMVEDGEALALTSGRYTRLEDLAILHRCFPGGIDRITRNDFFTRMYTVRTATAEVRPGDTCEFGLNIVNSETGFRALSVYHYILRLVCTNGAVVPVRVADDRIVHYGRPAGSLEEWLVQRLSCRRDDAAHLTGRLRQAGERPWDRAPARLSRRLAALLGRGEGGRIVRELNVAPSLYDAFNLLTNAAKVADPGTRFDLELAAGIMAMSRAPDASG